MSDTLESAEHARRTGRMMFLLMEESTALKERVAFLEQRVESLLMERVIVEELRREDAARIMELEERLCEAVR